MFEKLRDDSIHANRSCKFRSPSLEYLGLVIQAASSKIVESPIPKYLSQLRELITYYGNFLPNLSHLFHPLYNFLNKCRMELDLCMS